MKRLFSLSLTLLSAGVVFFSCQKIETDIQEPEKPSTEQTVNTGRCPDCGTLSCSNRNHDICPTCQVSKRPPAGCICQPSTGNPGGENPGTDPAQNRRNEYELMNPSWFVGNAMTDGFEEAKQIMQNYGYGKIGGYQAFSGMEAMQEIYDIVSEGNPVIGVMEHTRLSTLTTAYVVITGFFTGGDNQVYFTYMDPGTTDRTAGCDIWKNYLCHNAGGVFTGYASARGGTYRLIGLHQGFR